MQDLKKHSIKLEDEPYRGLDEFRLKHETYSMAVFRLLQMYRQLSKMMRDLAGAGSSGPELLPGNQPPALEELHTHEQVEASNISS